MTSRITDTTSGKINGVDQGGVVSFRGIPYAASPIGELRFAPPSPHAGWAGVREATQAGPAVPQPASRLERVMGPRVPDWDEDGCLTVNVHVPRHAFEGGVPRPVLLWWHGGGFSSGSGGWDWYDGAKLAELGDIVVVTANYRLGALGYLYLPEIGAANLGAQDQAAALRWVSDNIAAFGGDPRTVTVGGQSAGAFSSLSLALDPETAGLVTRVLLQSTPFGVEPPDAENAAETTAEFLRLLGLPANSADAKALRALPVEQLLSAYGRLARPGRVSPPMFPVLGGPGLPRSWSQALEDGALEGKSLMLGTTRDEATAFLAFDPDVRDLTATGAIGLLAGRLGDQAHGVYREHAARLPRATPGQVFTAIQTDALFRDGTLDLADHQAAGANPVYAYQFDYQPAGDEHALGATHCAELPFLFTTFDAYPDCPMLGRPTPAARELGRAFATTVAEFVTTGSVRDWLPYAPGTPARVRHFG
ncbi:carboxylesterase/lipase family protein [Amycolatopsis saalfeldensis]|uniref:Carboxylic ester hydrolase n=1 Tax=Amycolatopsis saalfeldensis TaxID=394193 RepID=A0A1H8VHV9_9PSEU|nr:carboxylesterase family protein [Amycolatopsis saalfeldensis]SEP15005.1 para-nitrobenzyl esterase [Amycolatopsis saalfeldensis]